MLLTLLKAMREKATGDRANLAVAAEMYSVDASSVTADLDTLLTNLDAAIQVIEATAANPVLQAWLAGFPPSVSLGYLEESHTRQTPTEAGALLDLLRWMQT